MLRLIGPFWGKPRIAAWLISYLQEIEGLETAIFDLLDGTKIDNASGVLLDTIGKLVGVARSPVSETDENFRAKIKARIRANRSNGTEPDIAAVASLLLLGTTATWHLGRVLFGNWITFQGPIPFNHATLIAELRKAKAGGFFLNALANSSTDQGLRFSDAPTGDQPSAIARDQLEDVNNPGGQGQLFSVIV